VRIPLRRGNPRNKPPYPAHVLKVLQDRAASQSLALSVDAQVIMLQKEINLWRLSGGILGKMVTIVDCEGTESRHLTPET
jgi:hypothetical protein